MSKFQVVKPVPAWAQDVVMLFESQALASRAARDQSWPFNIGSQDAQGVLVFIGCVQVEYQNAVIAEFSGTTFEHIRTNGRWKEPGRTISGVRARGGIDDEFLVIKAKHDIVVKDNAIIFVITENLNSGGLTLNTPALNATNLQNLLFRQANDVVYDMMAGSFGVRTDNGIVTLSSTKNGSKIEYTVEQNPLDMSMAMPAFAMRVAPDAVKPGDIMYIDQKPVFVTCPVGKKIAFISTNGVEGTVNMPVNKLMGTPGVMVVKNMFEGAFGGGSTENPLSAMMPIMMMQAMSGQQSGGNDLFQQMMLMQAMQGMFSKK